MQMIKGRTRENRDYGENHKETAAVHVVHSFSPLVFGGR